ncbi:hypothetical protein Lal_00000434, partial [Lupinus albus]
AENILPWKDKIFSGSVILFSWYLFEVAECNFITLLSQILMVIMLILFGWYKATGLIPWSIPKFDDVKIQEPTFRFFYMKLNSLLGTFYDISIGKDLKLFSMCYFAGEIDNVNQEMKRLFNTLTSKVLAQIPKGSFKQD